MGVNRTTAEVRDASAEYAPQAMKPAVPEGYKQTEVGVIPEDWGVFRLRDHFTIYAGGDVPRASLSKVRSDSFPFPIFANAIQNKGLYGFTSQARSKSDSLTITARGYLGHAEYRPEPFFPIVRLLVLEPKGTVDSRLTTYAVNDRVEFAIESTGVPQLTAPQVGKYAIAAPTNVAEQRAIATALSDVDALLEGLDRLIAKKRDLKQAAMQQLLTGQTRLPGFEGEWKVTPLGSIAGFFSGGTPSTALSSYYGGEIPWITSGDLNKSYIWDVDGRITRDGLENSSAKIIERDTLLIALYGATSGVTAVSKIRAAINQAVLAVVPKFGSSLFLFYKLAHLKDWIINTYTQGGQPNLSSDIVKSLELELPAVEEQAAIATVLSDMDAEIEALEQRRAKTAALKQAMMQELLTGRTRLVEPEREEAATC